MALTGTDIPLRKIGKLSMLLIDLDAQQNLPFTLTQNEGQNP